ncbi:MAG: hypothetical protein QG549_879 [Patescibacteria group bacterium]|nr:hypothetical protein [Patescibacteria group bacterium]
MDQQSLNSLLSGAQSSSTQLQQQAVESILAQYEPIIRMLLTIGALMSVVFVIVALANLLHKWRVERAIFRIDKNLQSMVDASKPTPEPASVIADNTES